jgi:hypothetical protein
MEYVLTGEVNFMAQVLRNGITVNWKFGPGPTQSRLPSLTTLAADLP